jgi:hypothetical protein
MFTVSNSLYVDRQSSSDNCLVVGQFEFPGIVIPARLTLAEPQAKRAGESASCVKICLAREESRIPGPFARQPRARVTDKRHRT